MISKCCLYFILPSIASAQSWHLQLCARLAVLTGLPASVFPDTNLAYLPLAMCSGAGFPSLSLPLPSNKILPGPSCSVHFNILRLAFRDLQGPPEPGCRPSLPADLTFPPYLPLPCSQVGLCLFLERSQYTLSSAASLTPSSLPGTPPPSAFFLGSRRVPRKGHSLLIPSPKLADHLSVSLTDLALRLLTIFVLSP